MYTQAHAICSLSLIIARFRSIPSGIRDFSAPLLTPIFSSVSVIPAISLFSTPLISTSHINLVDSTHNTAHTITAAKSAFLCRYSLTICKKPCFSLILVCTLHLREIPLNNLKSRLATDALTPFSVGTASQTGIPLLRQIFKNRSAPFPHISIITYPYRNLNNFLNIFYSLC